MCESRGLNVSDTRRAATRGSSFTSFENKKVKSCEALPFAVEVGFKIETTDKINSL